ncbi:unnamed protein product, partial [Choristocarpus tenellus]
AASIFQDDAVRDIREDEGEGEISAVVQAHRSSLSAEDASKQGNLAAAARLHLVAARGFFQAAREVQEAKVLASSLLLLADSHAAKSEGATIRLRFSSEGNHPDMVCLGSSTGTVSSSRSNSHGAGAGAGTVGGLMGSERQGRRPHHRDTAQQDLVDLAMDDSIMNIRRTQSSVTERSGLGGGSGGDKGKGGAANDLRPRVESLLELEHHLSKLGLEPKVQVVRSRHHHPGTAQGHQPRCLSSALGESFCLLNQSVIMGAGGTTPMSTSTSLVGGGVAGSWVRGVGGGATNDVNDATLQGCLDTTVVATVANTPSPVVQQTPRPGRLGQAFPPRADPAANTCTLSPSSSNVDDGVGK